MRCGLALLAWICTVACHGCGSSTTRDARFETGREMVVRGEYAAAIPLLQQYALDDPQSPDASRAGLFLFKAHLATGDVQQAKSWCDWTAREYPDSLEAHKCRYKRALIALLEGDDADALARFQELSDQPDGPLAAEATAMARYLERRLAAQAGHGVDGNAGEIRGELDSESNGEVTGEEDFDTRPPTVDSQ